MLLLTIAIAGLLALGFALLAVGLRGRRTDDHPLCRRCGYDLGGSPRPTVAGRCPECGSGLIRRRAVRVGHRVRRRLPLTAGGLLLVLTSAVIIAGTWAHARHVDPIRYKPAWWLERDLRDATLRDEALTELTARLVANRLPASAVAAVADQALAAQAGPPAAWSAKWGTFVELAHAGGQLDRPRWARYGRQGLKLDLDVVTPRPYRRSGRLVSQTSVYQGDDFDVTVGLPVRPLINARFRALFNLDDLRISGKPVASRPTNARIAENYAVQYGGRQGWAEVNGPVGGGFDYVPMRIDSPVSSHLAVGPHAMVGTAHVLLYEWDDLPGADGRAHPLPDASKVLAAFDVPVAGTVLIGVRPVLQVDAADRAAMAAAFRDVTVQLDDTMTVSVRGRTENLPHRVAFGVSVQGLDGVSGDSHILNHLRDVVVRPPGQNGAFQVSGSSGFLTDATRADVTFTPDLSAVVDNVDPTPIWGEPIVIRNVQITAAPALRGPTIVNDALRAAVRQSIRDVTIVAYRDRQVIVRGRVVGPPSPLRTRVSLHLHGTTGDFTVPVGRVDCLAGAECLFELRARVNDDSPTQATVVFDPDDAPLMPVANQSPIWGEPCVFPDVAIKYLP